MSIMLETTVVASWPTALQLLYCCTAGGPPPAAVLVASCVVESAVQLHCFCLQLTCPVLTVPAVPHRCTAALLY